ncbi:MAG TPA: hypothetical protein VG817_03185, partial [Gemmatimonadales bacterium]|nr:hypothetical protein [Gemmatimonadales bacterium]
AWPGRIAFLFYHTMIGTRLLPGPVMALCQLLGAGSAEAWRRMGSVMRGRAAGWRAWRRQHHAAAPHRVTHPLETRQPVETGHS